MHFRRMFASKSVTIRMSFNVKNIQNELLKILMIKNKNLID